MKELINEELPAMYGESVAVVRYPHSEAVYLDLYLDPERRAAIDMPYVTLTPEQARKLGKRLKRAAKAASSG